uniref:Laminin, alpha 3 n=1 Tax=Tetraodon nigroviridis TaxID=99883 RepID=H3DJT5_TETNG
SQKCGPGFYRERAGPHKGQCVPCRCSGFSSECEAETGKCTNCQSHTSGERCERCGEGYYRGAVNQACQACPCPSTRNNFAVACLDIGSGVMECLCKRGYIGANCGRCAFGYYGNPAQDGGSCKPCSCKYNNLSLCDPLTGECISSGDSSPTSGCRGESCVATLLVEAEKWDGGLGSWEQRLQNISADLDSVSWLNHLAANVSATEVELRQASGAALDLVNVSVKVKETNVKAEDLLSGAEAIMTAAQGNGYVSDRVNGVHGTMQQPSLKASYNANRSLSVILLSQQLTKVKQGPPPTPAEQRKMVEAAHDMVQTARERGCVSQRDEAVREREEAQTFQCLCVVTVWNSTKNMAAADLQMLLDQSADALLTSERSLRRMAEPLSEDAHNRLRGLNLKSLHVLGHVEMCVCVCVHTDNRVTLMFHPLWQPLYSQLSREAEALLRASNSTKDLLDEVSRYSFNTGQGSAPALAVGPGKSLRNITEEADRAANQSSGDYYSLRRFAPALAVGPGKSLRNMTEEADRAANQSSEIAGQILEAVRATDPSNTAGRTKEESWHLWTDVSETERDISAVSDTVDTWKDRISKQKDEQESLTRNIWTWNNDLKAIRGDHTAALIESAKTAASAANSTIAMATTRLSNISREVEAISSTSGNPDKLLSDAEDMLWNLTQTFPLLEDKVRHVEELSGMAPPAGANVTASIRNIKEVIEDTRNLISSKLSFATIFNGSGYVELQPPRNLEDIRVFTVIDLLLNRHLSGTRSRRKKRQDKHKDGNAFVFYMGNKNTSGDYIGMAIRHKVLVCVYKLGGVVHEVETSQVTKTSTNSSNMDRVIFNRVYQDAEVHITHNFTSQQPVQLPPKRNLPNTTAGVLELEPQSFVFYVGGYPQDFSPPAELDYPKFRGAMKVTYINDNPVSLFNYMSAVNKETRLPTVRMPRSEVSDYYDGTGYRMAFIKDPDNLKRRFFKFRTQSRETNALLFVIGNEDTFFCLIVEGGFLVLRGRQAGQDLRVQSAAKVSLFVVVIDDAFTVHYGPDRISVQHIRTSYVSYYIGGLPASLRRSLKVIAPPLRGCVRHVTADTESVKYETTLGVAAGCPVSLLGVRAATVRAPLSADSLFVRDHQPFQVSMGFRSTHTYGTLIRSGSQASVHHFQLSLADGYAVFHSDNYTLRSDRRYSDGRWHYLSASRSSAGLELSIDNAKVTQNQSPQIRPVGRNRGKFTGCVSNLYTRRLDRSLTPADLSWLSQEGRDVIPGVCSLPGWKRPQEDPSVSEPSCFLWDSYPAGAPGCVKIRPQQAAGVNPSRITSSLRTAGSVTPSHSHFHGTAVFLPCPRPHFALDIKTTSTKGLILHVPGAGTVPLLALYIASGKIKMSLGQDRIIFHKQRSNDGNWHRVEFSVEESTFHLLVDGVPVTDGHLANDEGSSLGLHSPVYLGGDPGANTKGHNVPKNSIIGCVRNFKLNKKVLREPEASHNTPPCFNTLTEKGTYFGGGYIVSDKTLHAGSQFELVFELRPHRLSGLLLQAKNNKTSLNVFLNETEVVVEMKDGAREVRVSVTPPRSLCDGEFHTVTVSQQQGTVGVSVDSVSEHKDAPPASTALDTLHIGGKQAPGHLTLIHINTLFSLIGCLRNVTLDGSPVVFQAESRVGHVISRCPAD